MNARRNRASGRLRACLCCARWACAGGRRLVVAYSIDRLRVGASKLRRGRMCGRAHQIDRARAGTELVPDAAQQRKADLRSSRQTRRSWNVRGRFGLYCLLSARQFVTSLASGRLFSFLLGRLGERVVRHRGGQAAAGYVTIDGVVDFRPGLDNLRSGWILDRAPQIDCDRAGTDLPRSSYVGQQ
jgi:hypothetical protein